MIDDVEWEQDGTAAVLLRRSKTDPEGTGKWLYLSERATTATREWLHSAELSSGFILRGVKGRARVGGRLSDGQIARIYKRLAERAGFSTAIIRRISGHSMRVGGAQDLLNHGATLTQIMSKGGWTKTETVMRYVKRAKPSARWSDPSRDPHTLHGSVTEAAVSRPQIVSPPLRRLPRL